MDLQVDWRRTLEATEPEPEPEAEPADAAEQEAAVDVVPTGVDTRLPLVYPRELPASSANADAETDVDFSQELPELPDDDDLLSDDGDKLDAEDADDEAEEETSAPHLSHHDSQHSRHRHRLHVARSRDQSAGPGAVLIVGGCTGSHRWSYHMHTVLCIHKQ
jgi:hypothetical protein